MQGNLASILLMVFAMAGFAVEDMFVKLSSSVLPTGQILLIIGFAGTLFFAALARARGLPALFAPGFLHPAILARNGGELVGTVAFVTAITTAELSIATAVFQAFPLAVTLGAALFLGETVGWRRWSAIAVGFVGVIIVIRPGMAGFDPASLWSVLAIIGLAVRDLATRRAPRSINTLHLAAWGMAVVSGLGLVMLLISGGAGMPDLQVWSWLGGAILGGCFGYWALTEATRIGEIGLTTPFRYTRLVFALIVGMLVFGERPDLWTWLGSALIVASGLYTLAREQRQRRLSSRRVAG